jgi:hypothetical protein
MRMSMIVPVFVPATLGRRHRIRRQPTGDVRDLAVEAEQPRCDDVDGIEGLVCPIDLPGTRG